MLVELGSIYLGVVVFQGGLKYLLNLTKGRVLEEVNRDLRMRVLDRHAQLHQPAHERHALAVDEGTTVSMIAAESEDVSGFASESLATPLLQIGTIVSVLGYLLWVEPLIAALAIVIYGPQIFIVRHVQSRINRLARRRTTQVRRLGRHTVGTIKASETDWVGPQVRAHILIGQIFKLRLIIYRYKYFLTFLGNFLDSLGPIVVVTLGGYLVIMGQTDVSTLVVFISGFQKISNPWDDLVNFYRAFSNTRVTFRLIGEALDGKPSHLRSGVYGTHHVPANA